MRSMPLWIIAVVVLSLVAAGLAQDSQPQPASRPAGGPAIGGPLLGGPARPVVGAANLTQAQEDELLAFLKKMDAEEYGKLMQLREINPPTYHSNVRSWYLWMVNIKRYPESIQKAYVVQQESWTHIYRFINELGVTTDDSQRKAITEQLRGAVAQLFDAQMTVQGERLEQLEQQLSQLKADYEANKANRDKKIDEMLKSFTRPAAPVVSTTSQPATSPAK